jgi:hypothetical protein
MELRVGDFVYIKESVIDKKVQDLLIAMQNRSAMRWDGYRNFKFEILGVDEENLIMLRDPDGNEIHISKRALEPE